MAELVTIDGQQYKKRDPLGVLGLSFITLGIYWFYWYYMINDEIRRFEKDDTVRPGMALLAITLGWLIIVPPFISVYNTSKHIVRMEERSGHPAAAVAGAQRDPPVGRRHRHPGLHPGASQPRLGYRREASASRRRPRRRSAAASRMTDDLGTAADHVLANRVSWDADARHLGRARPRSLGRRGDHVGYLECPGVRARAAARGRGLDAVELGCGTGYVSSWLARRGARPVGLDNSARQLATARMFQEEFGSASH